MTSPSWKNRRTIRWSILLRNRLEGLAGALLLAVTATWATPGLCEDAPTLNTLKQQSPTQRWERLKSQSAIPDAPTSAPKAATSRPGVIMPLPEDDIAIVPSEIKLAPALPTATEEPRWIVPARPIPVVEEPVPTPDATEAVVTPVPVVKPIVATPTPLVARSAELPRAQSSVTLVAQEPTPVTTPDTTPVVSPDATPATKPLERRRLRTIQEISPYYDTTVDDDIRKYAVKMAGEYNVAFGAETFHPREFPDTMFPWEPSNFYHYPLYFEDAVLERYGHTYHPVVQPVVSIAKFSTQLVLLPYQMTLDPPDCPKYALGWYRPGDCAPKLRYQPPLNAKAAAVEAGVVTGLFFLIP